MQERMNIVITGHVDHGKSTLVGRLLADTNSLPQGKLDGVKASCEKNGRVFEYSMLLDALEDEQKQGITIDSARIFFKSAAREYVIIDAPGHIEFLRNMLSGASRAVAAILVIDAIEGVAENSKRHGLLLSLLGVSQVVVAINKLDALGYSESIFRDVRSRYEKYLAELNVKPLAFVPISAREGDNIVTLSAQTPWYRGQSVLEALDSFQNLPSNEDSFFAMPLQDIYRFSKGGDNRRIYAGTIASGRVKTGDLVRFLPSEKEARIASVEAWNAPPREAAIAGQAAGFTLKEDIYVRGGEVMTRSDEAARVSIARKIRANVIWLGQNPLEFNKSYLLKIASAKVSARLEKIERTLDESVSGGAAGAENSEISGKSRLKRHECGSVVLSLLEPVALSAFYENADLGRFVLVDGYDAAGGGIVLEVLKESEAEKSRANFEDELFALLRRHFPHRFKDDGFTYQI
ncbi:MAG: GTP-binding protein [Helicobacteraceae bacterium]|jgi:bifunctional enzyme CysN/CysC/sulfate adenylyltransferase subunit 1|nr:GTP-binding protein [Helicobacteraceae bacterium]